MNDEIRVALIGGTGLGDRLQEGMAPQDVEEHEIDTPFGRPSSTIVTGRYNGIPIAILQRHGPGHVLNPARVPYRANIYALKALGCTPCLASGATGSLHEGIAPGDVVICDQIIDRT
ncbi:MAG: phosphorylase family protein, partial [Planctomycetota bacterium]